MKTTPEAPQLSRHYGTEGFKQVPQLSFHYTERSKPLGQSKYFCQVKLQSCLNGLHFFWGGFLRTTIFFFTNKTNLIYEYIVKKEYTNTAQCLTNGLSSIFAVVPTSDVCSRFIYMLTFLHPFLYLIYIRNEYLHILYLCIHKYVYIILYVYMPSAYGK